jgi:nicotinamide mononucleotide adenylyltransferase
MSKVSYYTLDFTRCERADGSAYGTGGTCRKGVEAPLEEAVVQGRFNLAHSGHATFVKKVLDRSKRVNVIISSQEGERPGGVDGKAGNLDWNFRKAMLSRAFKKEGIDMSRVRFIKDVSPDKTIQEMVKKHGSKVGVFLGKDERNGIYAKELAERYGVNGGLIEVDPSNRKETASSTAIRKAIDAGDRQTLRKIFERDRYLERLARAGRRYELGQGVNLISKSNH